MTYNQSNTKTLDEIIPFIIVLIYIVSLVMLHQRWLKETGQQAVIGKAQKIG